MKHSENPFGNQIIPISESMTVSSRVVAEKFGKQHKNVLQSIESLEIPAEWGRLNFQHTPYVDPQNGQTYKSYEITRDGFTLLAMGFTGKKAMEWKLKFIEAFNAMEQRLRQNEGAARSIGDVVETVLDYLAARDPRLAAVRYVPAKQVCEDHGAIKRPKGFVLKVSNALALFCQRRGTVVLRDLDDRRLFDRAAVREWEVNGGWDQMRLYLLEKQKGQSVLNFPQHKRRDLDGPEHREGA